VAGRHRPRRDAATGGGVGGRGTSGDLHSSARWVPERRDSPRASPWGWASTTSSTARASR
jgi:hypothetical protein